MPLQATSLAAALIQGSSSGTPGQGRSEFTPPQAGGGGSAAVPVPGGAVTPYLSPVIRIDTESGLVLLQYRDKSTGDQRDQIPSENVVRQYRSRVVETHRAQLAKALAPVSSAPAAQPSAAVTPTPGTGSSDLPDGSFSPAPVTPSTASAASGPAPSTPSAAPAVSFGAGSAAPAPTQIDTKV